MRNENIVEVLHTMCDMADEDWHVKKEIHLQVTDGFFEELVHCALNTFERIPGTFEVTSYNKKDEVYIFISPEWRLTIACKNDIENTKYRIIFEDLELQSIIEIASYFNTKTFKYDKNNQLIPLKRSLSMKKIFKNHIDENFTCWLLLQGYDISKSGVLSKK